ncbi:twitching motility protein PilT [Bacteroidia bacterium]|nr:twitching motility protein PilT [Bacteroidia bacterium]
MDRYLLDTHIALYLMTDSNELERDIREILDDYNNLLYISTVSVQEMVFLKKRNRVKLPWKKPEDTLTAMDSMNLQLLPVKREHLETFARLTIPESHYDPNDHVIISQAITEKMRLVSSDRQFENYTSQKLRLLFNQR